MAHIKMAGQVGCEVVDHDHARQTIESNMQTQFTTRTAGAQSRPLSARPLAPTRVGRSRAVVVRAEAQRGVNTVARTSHVATGGRSHDRLIGLRLLLANSIANPILRPGESWQPRGICQDRLGRQAPRRQEEDGEPRNCSLRIEKKIRDRSRPHLRRRSSPGPPRASACTPPRC